MLRAILLWAVTAGSCAALFFLGGMSTATACACPQMTLKVSDLLNKNPEVLASWPDNAVAVVGMAVKQEIMVYAPFVHLDTTFNVQKTLIGTVPEQIRFRSGKTSCDVSVHVAETVVLVFSARPDGWRLIVCEQAMMDVTPRELLSAIR
jgi:hypothetical protein